MKISMAILSLLLIQVGQLSVTGERMCNKLRLTDLIGLSLPRKSVDKLIDRIDMTIAVNYDIKLHSNKQRISKGSQYII